MGWGHGLGLGRRLAVAPCVQTTSSVSICSEGEMSARALSESSRERHSSAVGAGGVRGGDERRERRGRGGARDGCRGGRLRAARTVGLGRIGAEGDDNRAAEDDACASGECVSLLLRRGARG